MRILSVISTLDRKAGGPAEAVRNFSKNIPALGHTYEVLCCDDPSIGHEMDVPGAHAVGPWLTLFIYTPRLKPWLQANAENYDAIIVHGLWEYLGIVVRSVCKRKRIPYYVFCHGMLDPYFIRSNSSSRLKKRALWFWQHRVLRDAAAVLFTSKQEKLAARNLFRPYEVKERVVAYGASAPPADLDSCERSFRSEAPSLEGRPYLLYMGRIHPKKGCDLLINAFAATASNQRQKLVIAGPDEGPYASQMKELVKDLRLDGDVLWTGMLKGASKYGALAGADAFILPSHQENFGIAVAEALSCGTPVLLSKAVNIWEEIVEDRAGLAEDDTLEGTMKLLQDWQALSDPERKGMSMNAQACYSERFSAESSARSVLLTLQETAAIGVQQHAR